MQSTESAGLPPAGFPRAPALALVVAHSKHAALQRAELEFRREELCNEHPVEEATEMDRFFHSFHFEHELSSREMDTYAQRAVDKIQTEILQPLYDMLACMQFQDERLATPCGTIATRAKIIDAEMANFVLVRNVLGRMVFLIDAYDFLLELLDFLCNYSQGFIPYSCEGQGPEMLVNVREVLAMIERINVQSGCIMDMFPTDMMPSVAAQQARELLLGLHMMPVICDGQNIVPDNEYEESGTLNLLIQTTSLFQTAINQVWSTPKTGMGVDLDVILKRDIGDGASPHSRITQVEFEAGKTTTPFFSGNFLSLRDHVTKTTKLITAIHAFKAIVAERIPTFA
tara:strand:- start:247 stop:1272 length:1026 start_codon:yes stop_codon:yes gene_type:complete